MKSDFTNEELHEIEKAMDWFAGEQLRQISSLLHVMNDDQRSVYLSEMQQAYDLRRNVSAKVRQYFNTTTIEPENIVVPDNQVAKLKKYLENTKDGGSE